MMEVTPNQQPHAYLHESSPASLWTTLWSRRARRGIAALLLLAAALVPASSAVNRADLSNVPVAGCDDYDCDPISTWST